MDAKELEVKEYKSDMRKWEVNDLGIKHAIASTILDSLFTQVMHLETAPEMFQYLMKTFGEHSHLVIAQLNHELHGMICPEKGNVQEHFDKLHTLREKLSSAGQNITDKDFMSIIMLSLPPSYDSQVSSIMTLSKLSDKVPTLDSVMYMVEDEYNQCSKGKKSAGSTSTNDTAYSASSSCSGKPFKGKCYKCEGSGHHTSKCPTPDEQSKAKDKKAKGKKGKRSEKRKSNKGKDKSDNKKVAAAKDDNDSNNEPDGVWFANVEDSWEDQSDWLSEADEYNLPYLDDNNTEEEACMTMLTYTMLVSTSANVSMCTELYDSRAMRHIVESVVGWW
jgi:gag-polypeptide of LTR copia-type